MNSRTIYRRRAKELGLDFAEVAAVYSELRELARAEREREWGIRRDSWHTQVPEGCKPFWRHGWQARYRHAFAAGDRNNIPGFDDTAAAVAETYPELAAEGDPAERLYEFLKEPHNTLPTAAESWEAAIEQVMHSGKRKAKSGFDEDLEFAFGANLEF